MKRIMVIGPGNAGKSTLATELGYKLNLPVYHLDRVFWLPKWIPRELKAFQQEQQRLVTQKEWIIEGDFKKSYELRAERADTIIFLNFPLRILIPRFIKRVYKYRGKTRPDMTLGNEEKINLDYIKWLYRYDRSVPLGLIDKYRDKKTVYILNNPKDVKSFLKKLEAS